MYMHMYMYPVHVRTADHMLSAHAHNWASNIGNGHQQTCTLCSLQMLRAGYMYVLYIVYRTLVTPRACTRGKAISCVVVVTLLSWTRKSPNLEIYMYVSEQVVSATNL